MTSAKLAVSSGLKLLCGAGCERSQKPFVRGVVAFVKIVVIFSLLRADPTCHPHGMLLPLVAASRLVSSSSRSILGSPAGDQEGEGKDAASLAVSRAKPQSKVLKTMLPSQQPRRCSPRVS